MINAKYTGLKLIASLAHEGDWQTEPPLPGRSTGWWVHNGGRVHIADNVGCHNAAFIAAANPKVVTELVCDFQAEHQARLAADLEVDQLRLENEALRNGPRGDYDLDAWLDWCVEQKKIEAGVQRPEFEAEERDGFQAWYRQQNSPAGHDILETIPHLFARRTGDGFYVIPTIEIEWRVWWGRATSVRR